MAQCLKCGATLQPGMPFCTKCGAPCTSESNKSVAPQRPQPLRPSDPKAPVLPQRPQMPQRPSAPLAPAQPQMSGSDKGFFTDAVRSVANAVTGGALNREIAREQQQAVRQQANDDRNEIQQALRSEQSTSSLVLSYTAHKYIAASVGYCLFVPGLTRASYRMNLTSHFLYIPICTFWRSQLIVNSKYCVL